MSGHALTLIGAEGSPYSRKMRALLRYRQIPFHWVVRMGPEYRKPPKIPVDLVPVLVWHDNDGTMREAAVDSTPMIRRLEQEFDGRSVVPPDPALAFVASLIEDYADEWCTKLMFHYRWSREADIQWAKYHLMREINPATPATTLEQMGSAFAQRQISRLWVVGSNEVTAPIIESSYTRLLDILSALLETRLFLFGERPSCADFGLYGQLVQLCTWDPTPLAIARERAPRVVAWCTRMEDLGGWDALDTQWQARDTVVSGLQALLAEIGRTYVPFLLANARALEEGAEQVRCDIDGASWTQKPFPYQGKCLRVLREEFELLSAGDADWVRTLFAQVDCIALLPEQGS